VTSVGSAPDDSTLRIPNPELPANTVEKNQAKTDEASSLSDRSSLPSRLSGASDPARTVHEQSNANPPAVAIPAKESAAATNPHVQPGAAPTTIQSSTNPSIQSAAPAPIQSSTNPSIQSAASAPIQQSTNPLIQQVYRDPFPISPLATTPPARKQPRNHIPVLDIYGQLIQWIPRDEEPKIEDRVGFENRRGHNICWLNPKLIDPAPVHRNVPIVSWEGQILEWVPAEFEPFEKAEPIRSRRYLQYKIGWWEQARERIPQHYSSAGAMVG
jgi:hypothetical protein